MKPQQFAAGDIIEFEDGRIAIVVKPKNRLWKNHLCVDWITSEPGMIYRDIHPEFDYNAGAGRLALLAKVLVGSTE